MKSNRCPVCKSRFPLRHFFSYANLLGVRRTLPCPNCDTLLRWAIRPLIIMNTGSGILVAAAASVFVLSERLLVGWNTPTILFSLGAAITLVSIPLMRFEVVDRKQQ
jgi:hypothetical protein